MPSNVRAMTDESPKQSRRSANERRAAAQAMRQQQLAKERQRRNLMAGGGVLVVLVILGTLVGIAISKGNKNTSGPATSAQDALVSAVTKIPDSTYNTIGAAGGKSGGNVVGYPTPINTAAMTKDGKPRILYVGAEWCPYCAAQRWALAAALSRFGTFSNLGQTVSASNDVYPSTPTLSFYKSTFTSPYVVFDPYETQDNQRNTLVNLSSADNALFTNPQLGASGFPFIDLGGKYKAAVMFNPGVLHSDATNEYSSALSYTQIEAALKDPNSAIAKGIVGSANVLTATICKLTNNQPANVCTSPGVKAAAADVS